MNRTKAYDYADENEIRSLLSEKASAVKIEIVPEVASTNDELKKQAQNGKDEISVLIAEAQTGGKGSKGRSFFSPKNSGCYMSFLLRPEYTTEECTLLTTMAATAAARSIEKVTGKKTQIKWVNDVFMDGRKVAGILTEGAVSSSRTTLQWAVVGIGINISPPEKGFPDEIADIAGTIVPQNTYVKNRLIAEIINSFVDNYYNLTAKKFMEHYRKRLFFLGKEVTVIEADCSYKATAITVDSMGHLIIKTGDGNEKVLYGGEISVKPL